MLIQVGLNGWENRNIGERERERCGMHIGRPHVAGRIMVPSEAQASILYAARNPNPPIGDIKDYGSERLVSHKRIVTASCVDPGRCPKGVPSWAGLFCKNMHLL